MQLVDDWIKKWENIVEQVEKEHIPIECVKKVVFRMTTGTRKTINLRKLKDQGLQTEEISLVVDRYVRDNSDNIANMEFILDVEAVAEILQPETDKLLQGMK